MSKKLQGILTFAVVFLPFTLLRVGIMGIGEIVFLFFSLFSILESIRNTQIPLFDYTKFWLIYLLIAFIGGTYSTFFISIEYWSFNGMVYDSASYIMILMSCFALEKAIHSGRIHTKSLLISIFYASSIVLSLLYIYSFYSTSFLGFRIKYYDRFVPLAKNLHQVSMFLVPLPFIGLAVFEKAKSKLLKLFTLILIGLDVSMAYNSGSDKAIMALYVGAAVYVALKFYYLPSKKINRYFNFIIYLALIIMGLLFNFNTISEYLVNYFNDIDGGGARAYLYEEGVNIGLQSPLFGLGAGPHIPFHSGQIYDAHQTFLTIFLQTGLLGLFIFGYLIIKGVKKQFHYPAIIAAMTTIVLYASGGDILRRLPIWIILILLYTYNLTPPKGFTEVTRSSKGHIK